MGYYSLYGSTSTNYSVGIGHLAGRGTAGIENTFLGSWTGFSGGPGTAYTSHRNTAVGARAMQNTQTGSNNIAVGYSSLYSQTTGNNNLAVGYQASYYGTTASDNLSIGYNALHYNQTGTQNTIIGNSAQVGTVADQVNYVTAIGYGALTANRTDYNTAIGGYALYNNTTGQANTALGSEALETNSTGSYNTGIGHSALFYNTGSYNTALGYWAGLRDTSGTYNTALGYQAMVGTAANAHNFNTAVGSEALYAVSTGSYNSAVGHGALDSLTTGANNVAVGYKAANALGAGSYVTAVGYEALNANTASNQTAVGYRAGYSNAGGLDNTSVGHQALYFNSTGGYNVAVGKDALLGASGNSHSYNTAVGYGAGSSITSASANVMIGYLTGNSITSGSQNIAIGAYAFDANTTAHYNIAIGYEALSTATSSQYNTAVGHSALKYAIAGGSFSGYNTAIGVNALRDSTTGGWNTAMGVNSLANNETGYYNVAMGIESLYVPAAGLRNVAIGYQALRGGTGADPVNSVVIGYQAGDVITSADSNTLVGYQTGHALTTGGNNSAFGLSALSNMSAGTNNIALGMNAMYGSSGGDYNTTVGGYTLNSLTSGDGNTAMGYSAGSAITTGTYNTFIGYNANASAGTYTNSTAIGYNVSVAATGRAHIGNGQSVGGSSSWNVWSDERLKYDIVDNHLGLNFINRLQARNFKYTTSSGMYHAGELEEGFIAQEVEQIINDMGVSFSGLSYPENPNDYYRLSYEKFVVPLVNAVQELYASSSPLYAGIAIDTNHSTSTPFLMIDENGDLAYSGGSITAQGTASTSTTTYDSGLFSLQGSSWDNSTTTAITTSFSLINKTLSTTSSRLEIGFATGTNGSLGMSQAMLTITNAGDVAVSGDLTVGRRLYLGSKTTGMGSTSTYLFVDDTLGASSTYIATNADGWQASTAYDYAERYESNEQLEPGDLVTADPNGINKVKRSTSSKDIILGIVSTKPGFMTGGPAPDTYPVALAGRVPTKVSTQNGHIRPGDFLAPSDMPGVAVKATEKGSIIGVALEAYDKPGQGLISVFVNVSYMGDKFAVGGTSIAASEDIKGFAYMKANTQEVLVNHANLQAYPIVQLMPQGYVKGSYWVQDITGTSFKIMFSESQTADIKISYVITLPNVTEVPISDGTIGLFDTLTGQVTTQSGQPIAGPVAPEADPEPPAEPEPEVEPAPEPESEPLVTVEPEPTG